MSGRSRPAALGGIGALVILALGVPVGAIIYLLVKGGNSTLPAASLASAAGHTFLYAGAAGVIATVAALPIALLSVRFPRREVRFLERANMLVLCVPGLVIALSFTFFTEHYLAGHLYQTPLLLVLAYAVMFFPMAVVAVRASVARSPVGLEEVGSSLGVPRRTVFWRVTLPLIGPGLVAAFCLVFLEAATELTATLVLIPTNAQTLATQFWAFQTNLSYSQAAPYAGLMVLIAAVPSVVLGRWFDRLPSRDATTQPAGAPVPAPSTMGTMVSMKGLAIAGVCKSFGQLRCCAASTWWYPTVPSRRFSGHRAAGRPRSCASSPASSDPMKVRFDWVLRSSTTPVTSGCPRSGDASVTSPRRERSSRT